MGEFLERIQSASPVEDPDRTLEAVRAVFYAMMQGTDEHGCREVAALLPEELETIWKPALFTCLRDHRSSDGPPREADFVERVRRHVPDLEPEEVERLTRAVLDGLVPRLSEEAREKLLGKAPEEMVGDAAG